MTQFELLNFKSILFKTIQNVKWSLLKKNVSYNQKILPPLNYIIKKRVFHTSGLN
jgi:hypothetical protein